MSIPEFQHKIYSDYSDYFQFSYDAQMSWRNVSIVFSYVAVTFG